MTGPPHDTPTVTPRRADAGVVRLGRCDIDGLILCAEHFGAPYDLLAAALGVQPAGHVQRFCLMATVAGRARQAQRPLSFGQRRLDPTLLLEGDSELTTRGRLTDAVIKISVQQEGLTQMLRAGGVRIGHEQRAAQAVVRPRLAGQVT